MVKTWKDHRAELGKGPVCCVEIRDRDTSRGISILAWTSDWGEHPARWGCYLPWVLSSQG